MSEKYDVMLSTSEIYIQQYQNIAMFERSWILNKAHHF